MNRRPPGSATFRELPQLNHHFTRFDSARDAYRKQRGTPDAAPAVAAILGWLSRIGVRDSAIRLSAG